MISINMIARTMSNFTDCWSVPNTIGIGPIKRMPPPLTPRLRTVTEIITNTARIMPVTVKPNPKMRVRSVILPFNGATHSVKINSSRILEQNEIYS
jgi:hypothetical protein